MSKIKRLPVFLFLPLLVILLLLFVTTASQVGPVEFHYANVPTPGDQNFLLLRFVNLNMLHGFPGFRDLPTRVDLIGEGLDRLSASVVCLQEVPWTRITGSAASILSEKLAMSYVYLPANGNRKTILFSEGVAILSSYPISDVEYSELSPRAGFFEHRVALSVSIETFIGRIRIVCTHLTNGESDINLGQIQSLYDFASKFHEPLIIAGDFNAREDEPQIKFLQEKWTDVYRATHPRDPGHTCCIDDLYDPEDTLEERIDYIFISPGKELKIQTREIEVIFDSPQRVNSGLIWASDHAGLYAEFVLSH